MSRIIACMAGALVAAGALLPAGTALRPPSGATGFLSDKGLLPCLRY
ncbi:hypothetical protein GCM10022226_68650 [Sphaerisporangium flaviroseum]|uniref:Uncharacterized protein n=1 Tax=Sphaerisporangium flaviroseum TaxID=509199 RepID=A0ABP7J832_9ACTN